jgi:hypothetical protein
MRGLRANLAGVPEGYCRPSTARGQGSDSSAIAPKSKINYAKQKCDEVFRFANICQQAIAQRKAFLGTHRAEDA